MAGIEQFVRTEMLLGEKSIETLAKSKVAVFGIGGVGSYTAEALVRSGVGHLTFVDKDEVSLSNINRQIIALHSTVGRPKAAVMKQRALDINPGAVVEAVIGFYLDDGDFDFEGYDYIVDAVDTVTAKLSLAVKCAEFNIPVISAMGCGNRLDPGRLAIASIYDTCGSGCPLCRVMRKELRKRGVEKLDVVYSRERPVEKLFNAPDSQGSGRAIGRVPGSNAYVPAVAGLMMAGYVVNNLCGGVDRIG